jgi:uncharacterized protein YidB (DUF937 family)
MNFIDDLKQKAMSSVTGSIAGSNPEAAAVLAAIENHPGGVSGLVQSFHDNGLGGVVNSWIGTGANQSITPEQIQQVMGSGPMQAMAQKLGISPEEASKKLSQMLPTVIDKLTPNGSVPSGSNLMDIGKNLLSSFGKTGTNS